MENNNNKKELLGRSFSENLNILWTRGILLALTDIFLKDACAGNFLGQCSV